MASARRPIVARAVVGAAAAALTLAGCSFGSPLSQKPYAPSDGYRVELGDQVTAHNLLVLTSGEGEEGLLVGSFTNRTGAETVVSLGIGDGATAIGTVPLGPQETVLLGSADTDGLTVDEVPAPPGAHVLLTLHTPEGGARELLVPVQDDTLEEYADLVP